MSSKHDFQIVRRFQLGALVAAAALSCAAPVLAAGEMSAGPKSGLPVPRFVSLKPDRVNVRGGPTRDHEVTFVYTRAGLPVEITAEFGQLAAHSRLGGIGGLGLPFAAVRTAHGSGNTQRQESTRAALRRG